MSRLSRQDIVEKRAKCIICGYELTYPEYINDDKCVFHTEKRFRMGVVAWLRFALAEYRVMRSKASMAKRGLTEQDYFGCLGTVAGEVGEIKDAKGMGALLKELKGYNHA